MPYPEYCANPVVSYREVGDETILVDFGSDTIFSLNRTGGLIWAHVSQGLGTDEILARITSTHDAPESLVAAEVGELLGTLERHGLIVKRRPGPGGVRGVDE